MPRPPDPQLDPAGYLRSLGAVRERCKIVTAKAYRDELHHFDVDMRKFPDVVSFVANIIKVSSSPAAGWRELRRIGEGCGREKGWQMRGWVASPLQKPQLRLCSPPRIALPCQSLPKKDTASS